MIVTQRMQNKEKSSPDESSPRKVFVYEDSDQGACADCVLWTVDALGRALSWLSSEKLITQHYSVGTITAKRIVNDASWKRECDLLVFPGGRDLPYCALLNGLGNQEIKSFVCDKGGSYFGICAGAYYACQCIEFEKQDSAMSVCGPRELAFFGGMGRGSFYPGFDYRSRSGARAAPIHIQHSIESHLSAEYVSDLCGNPIYAYFNGGCEFIPSKGIDGGSESPVESRLQPVSHAVAKYCDHPRGEDEGSTGEPCNAVVLSECGSGRAVLTGVHLEVGPESFAVNNVDSLPADVVSKLTATNRQRQRLFALLVHALLK